ncbi:MAG: hypothetical protein ACE5H9_21810 [Anaerolineae bacterium]
MSITFLDEMARVQRDLQLLRMAVEALQVRVDELVTDLQKQTEEPLVKFADLEGLWEGLDIGFEAIKAAEYQVPEDL